MHDPALPRLNLRRLDGADLPEVERFLVALDADDRHARFHLAVSDWWMSAYVQSLDPARVILIGAFWTNPLVGLAEGHPAGSAAAAELAVVVHPACRRAGL